MPDLTLIPEVQTVQATQVARQAGHLTLIKLEFGRAEQGLSCRVFGFEMDMVCDRLFVHPLRPHVWGSLSPLGQPQVLTFRFL